MKTKEASSSLPPCHRHFSSNPGNGAANTSIWPLYLERTSDWGLGLVLSPFRWNSAQASPQSCGLSASEWRWRSWWHGGTSDVSDGRCGRRPMALKWIKILENSWRSQELQGFRFCTGMWTSRKQNFLRPKDLSTVGFACG